MARPSPRRSAPGTRAPRRPSSRPPRADLASSPPRIRSTGTSARRPSSEAWRSSSRARRRPRVAPAARVARRARLPPAPRGGPLFEVGRHGGPRRRRNSLGGWTHRLGRAARRLRAAVLRRGRGRRALGGAGARSARRTRPTTWPGSPRARAAADAVAEVGCGDGVLMDASPSAGWGPPATATRSPSGRWLWRGRPGMDAVRRFDGEHLPVGRRDLRPGRALPRARARARPAAPAARDRAGSPGGGGGGAAGGQPLGLPAGGRGGRRAIGHLHRFNRGDVHVLCAAAGLHPVAELSDPLPYAVHAYFAAGPRRRAKAAAKTAVRRALFTASTKAAERAFTVHYACLAVKASRLARKRVREGPGVLGHAGAVDLRGGDRLRALRVAPQLPHGEHRDALGVGPGHQLARRRAGRTPRRTRR